jgi:predicted nucleic-acid-binding protein
MAPPLDTNVIIRHLTADNPRQSPLAHQLMQELDVGARSVTLTEAVLVEAVQVLSSKVLYNLPRSDIRQHLRGIIQLRGVVLPRKPRYLRALDLYASTPRLSFVDALLAVYAEADPSLTVLSFDRGFDGLAAVTRREP